MGLRNLLPGGLYSQFPPYSAIANISSDGEAHLFLPTDEPKRERGRPKLNHTQEELLSKAKKTNYRGKQRKYRENSKMVKNGIIEKRTSLWAKVGGWGRIITMGRQYDLNMVKKVGELVTCPTARGAISPLATIATRIACHYCVQF